MVLFPLIFFTNKIFVLITQLVFCRVWLVIELRFMASKLAIIQKKKIENCHTLCLKNLFDCSLLAQMKPSSDVRKSCWWFQSNVSIELEIEKSTDIISDIRSRRCTNIHISFASFRTMLCAKNVFWDINFEIFTEWCFHLNLNCFVC